MLATAASAGERLRDLLKVRTVLAAGAFNPFVARLVEDAGYDAVYISGAALSNSMALPDEGLLSRARVLEMSRDIIEAVSVPVVIDVDTGFGGPKAAAGTVAMFEAAGAAAIHIEDQDARFKRCGHLEGKHLISKQRMVEKLEAAVQARRDPGFVIMARTDARSVEGLDAAIDRAQAYERAGVDMIFPEAPETREEFEAFRKALKVPLLANMTEFGKSPYLTDDEFAGLGYNLVIHPVTTFRLSARAIKDALAEMKQQGHQGHLASSGRLMSRVQIDSHLRTDV